MKHQSLENTLTYQGKLHLLFLDILLCFAQPRRQSIPALPHYHTGQCPLHADLVLDNRKIRPSTFAHLGRPGNDDLSVHHWYCWNSCWREQPGHQDRDRFCDDLYIFLRVDLGSRYGDILSIQSARLTPL